MTGEDLLLWSRVQGDDPKAFEALFRKYFYTLCLLSRRYTRDMTTSREVVQDLFIHLWENRKNIKITASIRSYLATATRFNSIRRIKADQKVIIFTDVLPDSGQELTDHLEYAELQAAIVRAIDGLPEQCRRVFELSRFELLKHSEIASRLEISVKTVEAHIGKALKQLQQDIGSIYNLMIFLVISALKFFS
jgi:RNA polymerase sigma-70 factor (ECF subfamily)